MKLIRFVLIPFLFINLILLVTSLTTSVSIIEYRLFIAVIFIIVAIFMYKKDKKTET